MRVVQFIAISILFIWGGGCAEVLAQSEILRFERFSLSDGLSNFLINSVTRAADGFLWVGTNQGLNQYDGTKVRVFSSLLPGASPSTSVHITSTARDPSNPEGVWVGTEREGLGRYDADSETFQLFTTANSVLDTNSVEVVYTSPDGQVWVATAAGGLFRFDEETNILVQYASLATPFSQQGGGRVEAFLVLRANPSIIWVGTTRGVWVGDVSSRNGETLERVPGGEGLDVAALAEVEESIWLGTYDGRLYRYDLQHQRFESSLAIAEAQQSITALVASTEEADVLWIGTGGAGVWAFNTQTLAMQPFTYNAQDPVSLSRNDVRAIEEDEDGILWVGTIIGLNKALVRPARFTPIRFNPTWTDAQAGRSVFALHASRKQSDTIWLGLLREGLYRYDSNRGRLYPVAPEADSLELIFAIHEDAEGGVWLGTATPALYHVDPRIHELTSYVLGASPDIYVSHIYESPYEPGFIWVSTQHAGLIKFDVVRRRVVEQYTTANGLLENNVWAVHEFGHQPGILWVLGDTQALQRLNTQTGEVHAYTRAQGYCLPTDEWLSVWVEPSGIIWLGAYAGGLTRFDPEANTCRIYTTAEGLPHNDVAALYKDASERLWMSTTNGLAFLDIHKDVIASFTFRDGLHNSVFHYQAWDVTPSGELLAGGINGFSRFYPENIHVQPTGPKVVLTQVLVDGERTRLIRTADGYESLVLKHNQNDLMFEFAALDLRAPTKNRYRVWLEGADDTWKELGTQSNERYVSLAAGTYILRFMGSNSDGYWTEWDSTLVIRILPKFWQTWWFWSLILSGAVGLLTLAYRYRIYQMQRVERTRYRIASDLHDDIGSKISNVALRLDLVSQDPSLGTTQQTKVLNLAQVARRVVDDLRDTVWIVDASHDTLPDIVSRMEIVAEQMLAGRRFSFEQPLYLPDMVLPMEKRRHLYLLYKEVIHNVVRHSQATHVDIRINWDVGRLRLVVQDNGCGFDVATVRQGHGLASIQNRADALQASLNLESIPGSGTTVVLLLQIT